MNILFVGDIVGSCGRSMLLRSIEELRATKDIDMIVVNGENSAHGKGISSKICDEFFENGVDVITTGNHVWGNKDIFEVIGTTSRLIRPYNLPSSNPGNGYVIADINGIKVGVLNLIGRIYMDPPNNCPFEAAESAIIEIKKQTNIILVDFHAEATSEKVAMGHFLDGKVSAVMGTHTHIQTADEKILSHSTAYITDVGMTGPYESILGMNVKVIVDRFTTHLPQKFELADGKAQFNAVMLDIDENSGKARKISRLNFTD